MATDKIDDKAFEEVQKRIEEAKGKIAARHKKSQTKPEDEPTGLLSDGFDRVDLEREKDQ